MQEKFDKFFADNNEKFLEVVDPSNLNQCFDLVAGWCNIIGVPLSAITHLFAYQIFTMPGDDTVKYFDLIPNTPNGIPQLGDIVVFGTLVGPAGHTSVATGKGDTNTFESFDENWGADKHCRLVNHPYEGCLGWLRLKVPCPETPLTDQTKLDLTGIMDVVNQTDLGILEFQSLKSKIKAWNEGYSLVTGANVDLQKGLTDVKQQLADCQNQPPVVTTKIIYKTETLGQFFKRVLGIKASDQASNDGK